jgi:hypothetical protein
MDDPRREPAQAFRLVERAAKAQSFRMYTIEPIAFVRGARADVEDWSASRRG